MPALVCCFLTILAAAPDDLGTRRQGTDWPCFLGPTGDNKSTETGLVAPWPEAGPRLVWQQRVDTGYAMPSISRGRLFHFVSRKRSASVECLRAETGGAPLWTFDYATDYEDLYGYDNGPRCQPVVDEDRVYTLGAEGMLHCLTASEGNLIWRVDTSREFGVVQNFFGVGSTPVVYGDLLLMQIGGSPADRRDVPPGRLDLVRGNGTAVVAFNKYTGRVVYQLSDELASYASPKLAEIAGRPWCFVFARGGLLGFDPRTGRQDFHFPWRASSLESVNASTPVVAGNEVLISETYGPGSALLRVEPGRAEVVWQDELRSRQKSLQTHWNTPIYQAGFVYGSSGRHRENAELRCVEWRTGKVRWSQPDLSRSSLLYVDGHFVCLTEEGQLLLLRATPERFDVVSQATLRGPLDPATGGESRLLRYPCWAAPILAHGLLYLRGPERLVCLELIAEK